MEDGEPRLSTQILPALAYTFGIGCDKLLPQPQSAMSTGDPRCWFEKKTKFARAGETVRTSQSLLKKLCQQLLKHDEDYLLRHGRVRLPGRRHDIQQPLALQLGIESKGLCNSSLLQGLPQAACVHIKAKGGGYEFIVQSVDSFSKARMAHSPGAGQAEGAPLLPACVPLCSSIETRRRISLHPSTLLYAT